MFQPLTPGSLEFRVTEEPGLDPGWFVPHIQDIVTYDPDGCFCLHHKDRPVGMVTTTCYQSVGWLGWLYVAEEFRFQGFGGRLMRKAVEYIESCGIGTYVLEAVVEAVALYKRLGFAEQFVTQHYRIAKADSTNDSETAVTPISRRDMDDIVALDRRYFHQDRRKLFEIVASNRNFAGFTAREGGRLVGSLFLTETAKDRQVSPLVFDASKENRLRIVRALTSAAFERSEKPLYLRCPMVEPDRNHILTELGAETVDYHTIRMYRGGEYSSEGEGILSLGCPGKG